MFSSYSVRFLTALVPLAVLAAAAQAQEKLVPVPCDYVASGIATSNTAVQGGHNMPMHIGMSLAGYQADAADAYINAANTLGSPVYHKWLSPSQFAAKFTGGPAVAGPVMAWLGAQGFTNVQLSSNGLFVTGDAPQSTVENAFRISISNFARSIDESSAINSTYFAPTSSPVLPASMAAKITGVWGLASKMIMTNSNSGLLGGSNISSFLTPSQIGLAYGKPSLNASLDGTGMKVCVISPTSWTNTDPQQFATLYGLGTVSLTEDKTDGTASNNGAEEASLDAEMIFGMAPRANVTMVITPGMTYQQWFDMFTRCATIDPQVISCSWGLGEKANSFNSGNASLYNTYSADFASIAAEGIPFFNASGDKGTYGTPPTVDHGAENGILTVTSVGGTQLKQNPDSSFTETPWTYTSANGGSGGGQDFIVARPSWQVGPHVVNADSNGKRQFPDISAVGSPFSGVSIVYQGVATGVAGTSVAAPLSAGLMTLLTQSRNARLGNINPSLYSLGTLLSNSSTYAGTHYLYYDMLGGTNGVQPSAGDKAIYNNLGWDFVTGWGSVDYSKMLPDLAWRQGVAGYSPDLSFYTPTGIAGQTWTRPMVFTTGNVAVPTDDEASFGHDATVNVNIGYTNSGNADSYPFVIGVYLDNVLKTSHQVKALTPSMKQQYLKVLSIVNPTVGIHTVRVVLNYGGGMLETNQANNAYSRTFTVHPTN